MSPLIEEEDAPHANYHSISMLNPLLRLRKLTALSSYRAELSG
jgi:hypothetical protein